MQFNSILFPGPAMQLPNADYTKIIYIPRDSVYEPE